MSATTRAELLRLCEELLVELRRMQHEGEVLAPWADDSAPDDFPFLKRLAGLADAALDAGAPAHYQRLRKLHAAPVRMPDSLWRLTEMIAALAECRLWALDGGRRKAVGGRRQKKPGKTGAAGRPSSPPTRIKLRRIPVEPGKRLRGGREILEAMEGAYTYARWRAFRREALKHGAPIEWPPKGGQPRAWTNVLRAWLDARVEAAERVREERERRDVERALNASIRHRAYTGGDDQALGVVKRPSGRRTR